MANFSSARPFNGNQRDEESQSRIDQAWKEKNYSEVLSLLENDYKFPSGFNLETLKASEDESQKKLKKFVEDRNSLHEWIREGELHEVEKYISETQSKYYFNSNGKSAACTAMNRYNYKIYACLICANASLHPEEMHLLDSLTQGEMKELEEEIRSYFPTNENSHIFHLLSKSKVINYDGDIGLLIKKLNKIPEISQVLKVIQYHRDLEIFFNFGHDNVKYTFPQASCTTAGVTLDEEGTIYVSGDVKEKTLEVLGTMAHECTHLAMMLLFENRAKPFREVDVSKKNEYGKIVKNCRLIQIDEEPSEIITGMFRSYPKEDFEKELIVRVPQILIQYGNYGRSWLRNNTPELYKFFNENIIPECQKFIKNSFLLKPRNIIRELNRSEGELINIKILDLNFKNLDEINESFNDFNNENIFTFITKNTFLGLLRIFQIVNDGSNEKYLIFKLKNFLIKMYDVVRAFCSIAADTLIIECPNVLQIKQRNSIKEFLVHVTDKKNKKIIFVIKDDNINNFRNLIKEIQLNDKYKIWNYKEVRDENFSLFDFNENSQEKILENLVIFQGKEVKLRELINNDDLMKFVDPNLIVQLLEGAKIKVGAKLSGTSCLEGAYSDIFQEIVLDSLVKEIENSNDIFVFDRFENETELVNSFKIPIDVDIIEKLDDFRQKLPDIKKIFFTNRKILNREFQKICESNSDKKIYLIEKISKFFLKRIYNPKFYFKREFKDTKVMVNGTILKNFQTDENHLKKDVQINDVIIICNSDNLEKPENINPRILWLSSNDSEYYFKKLSATKKNVHLLNFQNGELTWVESSGSLSNLRDYIAEVPGKDFLTEDELVSEIINRKIVLLADEPGMGKSTTVTTLCESKIITDNHWVFRINLVNLVEVIKEFKSEGFDIEKVKFFLKEIDPDLIEKFNITLLNYALCYDDFPKKLLLVFDGFDELLDEADREEVINLLHFLKENCKCKIWVTTRVHFKKVLEDKLSTFAVKFEPISDSSKITFVYNYMKDRLKLLVTEKEFDEIFKESEDSKMSIYLGSFVENIIKIFKGNLNRFIGTPLQLLLLLEGSIKPFLNWVRSNDKDPDFNYLGKDILEVFKKFFARKYNIYFRKKGISEETRQREHIIFLENIHGNLAAYNCMKSNSKALALKIDKDSPERNQILLLVGLINEKLDFLHFTFREYFFAKWFLDGLIYKRFNVPNEDHEHFIIEVFCAEGFTLARTFINLMLKNYNENQEIEIINNLNELVLYESTLNAFKETSGSFFHVAIIENNNYLFDFLFKKLNWVSNFPFLLTVTNSNQANIFHDALYSHNDYVFDFLISDHFPTLPLNDQKTILNATDSSCSTPLHLALCRGDFKIVKKVFEKMEKIFSKNEIVEFLRAGPLAPIIIPALWGFIEVNKFLFDKFLEFATEQQTLELFYPVVRAARGLNILGNSANIGNLEIFKYTFEKAERILPVDLLKAILFTFLWPKIYQSNSFISPDIVNYLIKKAKGLCGKNKSWVFSMKQDALFSAISKNFYDVVEILLENESKNSFYKLVNTRFEKEKNLFLFAAKKGSFEVVNLILKKAEENLSPESMCELLFTTDDAQKTALHIEPKAFMHVIINSEISWKDVDFNYESLFARFPLRATYRRYEIMLEKLPLEKQYELLNMKDQDNRTPLHYACLSNSEERVKLFLPDTDDNLIWEKQFQLMCVKDNYGNTPFHYAAICNGLNIVQFLIQKLKEHLSEDDLGKYLNQENDWNKMSDEVLLIISEALN